MQRRPVPGACPSCGGELRVTRLECSSCDTGLSGEFVPNAVTRLDAEARRIYELFIGARGNLKQVQRELGVSYPTTRQRVDAMFRKLEGRPDPVEPRDVLQRLRAGEIDVVEAERLLRGD
jgi:hypothetical protein